jgi:hypothetical protein
MSQHMDALQKAQKVRLDAVRLKQEINEGKVSALHALADPRARPVTVFALLNSQRGWGRAKARKALAMLALGDTVRVRDLNDRQMRAVRLFLGAGRKPSRAQIHDQQDQARVIAALLRSPATRAELTVRLYENDTPVNDLDSALVGLQRRHAVTWKKVDGFLLYSVTDWSEVTA